ncbi:hypothetical protein C8R46DRAFT_1320036 [Mycena filopes]|nr:hypothetical protein C8R46DRAFT_1320036 [Mycena filopes]
MGPSILVLDQDHRKIGAMANIADLKARLLILEMDAYELEKDLKNFKYPVLESVPTELVSEIFIATLPADGRVRPSPHAVPLSLAQICRHWRDIALATPQLWTSVDFEFLRGPPSTPKMRRAGELQHMQPRMSYRHSPYDGAGALLRLWFHRAKGLPLSITLRCARDRPAMPEGIFSAIGEFRAQWGRLEVALPSDDIPTLDDISGPLPMLRSLALDTSGINPTHPPHTHVLAAFQVAPQLQTVRLLGKLTLDNVRLPSMRLTTLELGEDLTRTSQSSAIFTHFPRLRHFTANRFKFQGLPTFENPPPLESLSIEFGEILEPLTLPYLRDLKCVLVSNQVPMFLNFLTRSACVLTHLELGSWSMDDDPLIQCLNALPHLTALEFRRLNVQSNRHLYAHMSAPAFLPRLQNLTISDAGDAGAPYDCAPIFAMLQGRRALNPGSVARLRALHLILDGMRLESVAEVAALCESIPAQLHWIVEGGLRLTVAIDTMVETPLAQWPHVDS